MILIRFHRIAFHGVSKKYHGTRLILINTIIPRTQSVLKKIFFFSEEFLEYPIFPSVFFFFMIGFP